MIASRLQAVDSYTAHALKCDRATEARARRADACRTPRGHRRNCMKQPTIYSGDKYRSKAPKEIIPSIPR